MPTFPDPLQGRQKKLGKTLVGYLDLRPGMRILVIGPEPAEAVLRAAQQAGPNGKVMVVNAQRAAIESLKPELDKMQIDNVVFHSASPYDLPLADSEADRAILVAVLNRILDKQRALRDVRRVLKTDGVLGVEQRLLDIGLPRREKVTRWCQEAGFDPVAQHGSVMHYLLTFRPQAPE